MDYPGVYLWDHPLVCLEDTSKIFIVEAVGYGQMDDKERARLFSLLFCVCSSIVYCSSAQLVDSCLENVPEVASVRNLVEVYEDNKQLSDLYLEAYAPFFCWAALRVQGQLVDVSGNKASPSQVFEQILQSTSRFDSGAGAVREQLVNTFRRRDCFDLSSQDLTSADPVKVKEFLKSTILGRSKPKIVNGVTLEGSILVSYCLEVADAVNSGLPAVLPAIVNRSAAFDLKELLTKIKLEYSSALKTTFGGEAVYPKKDILEAKLSTIRNEALAAITEAESLAVADPDQYLATIVELDKFIEQREQAVRLKQQELKKK